MAEQEKSSIIRTTKEIKLSKESILSRMQGRVGHIILNRPDSRNAITKQMWLAIPEIISELDKAGAEVLVFEGTGDSFAAGADIDELEALSNIDDVRSNWNAIANALNSIYNSPMPSIAAIDGPCMGGGCLLAVACDLRYASKRSRFSLPIAMLGIALDDANLGRFAALVGLAKAKELIFRGKVFTAAEAHTWGLLNGIFEKYEFASMLSSVTSEILANAPGSIRQAKASFARIYDYKENEANTEALLNSYLSTDFKTRIKWALGKD